MDDPNDFGSHAEPADREKPVVRPVNRRKEHLQEARESIVGFTIDTKRYQMLPVTACHKVAGTGDFELWSKDSRLFAKVDVFLQKTTRGRIFIGEGVRGSFRIVLKGNNALVWIGNECHLKETEIRSAQRNDFIAVGNGVTTTSSNTWVSGNGAGQAHPAIIIGDDCMLASDITLRNTDAHPIFDIHSGLHMNEPSGSLHLEPHVWLGDRVSVLKGVRIGANSVVALGSIVTKSLPRFSMARGVPARSEIKPDLFWARSHHPQQIEKAKRYRERYLTKPSAEPISESTEE